MEQTDKYKALAAFIRGYFTAYINGIYDAGNKKPDNEINPQTIKTIVMEHYDNMVSQYNDTLFFIISQLNYSLDEIEKHLKSMDPENTSFIELMRMACRTDEMYEAMKAEYKRNVYALLEGRFTKAAEHLKLYTRSNMKDNVDCELAIRLLVRTVMTAYAAGIREADTGKATLKQATLLSLLTENITLILHDKPLDTAKLDRIKTMDEYIRYVCRTDKNIYAMMDEMNITYENIIKGEGIISNDDMAN
ncbi:MAG: hypothetical protein J6B91_02970 [Prevotella sp.]|nr:hypothetical protein [Prevotella sp.]